MSESSPLAEPPLAEILGHFPGVDVLGVTSLGNGGGFSGAQLWRVATPRETLCLRRWPQEYPTAQWLRWLHGLLKYAADQGSAPLPVPRLHRGNDTVLAAHSALFELTPWLAGTADYRTQPSPARLTAALTVLAEFHSAVRTYPGFDQPQHARQAQPRVGFSPGLIARRSRLQRLLNGEFDRLAAAVSNCSATEIRQRGQRLLPMFSLCAGRVLTQLVQASQRQVALQPCIRDIWHDHILFTGDVVTGLIDFGAVRIETVAGDLARLIGSLVGDTPSDWTAALRAYEVHHPLTTEEHWLIRVFDRSSVLMSGLSWLQWICVEGRRFEDQQRVLQRLDENLSRMEVLCGTIGSPRR